MPPSRVADIFRRHQRQVQLDFHNSPLIPDVASEFDAERFARTLADAHVNSVTLTAKCHHGMCYYPTRTGTGHPALAGRDLLGEQIESLHRRGIRTPLYTTVGFEEDAATRYPEWRQRCRDGSAAVASAPAPWQYLNFLHPDYQEYVEAHLRELCTRYGDAVDGFFLDIITFHPQACWSDTSVRFRETCGFDLDDPATPPRFQAAAQVAFARRFSALLAGLMPTGATLFYNAPSDVGVDSTVGPRARYPFVTHAEIESLPSGGWGYQHFPRVARALSHWGKPWLGMTARFHKTWGDFGGIKPRSALEFECFRSQALGGANSVGDQLPPRGILDADAYALVGQVYAQCAAAEAFYEGSEALPQFGTLAAGYPGLEPGATAASDEGVMLMAAECHYDAALLDETADLSRFPLIQLPDTTVVTPLLAEKLAAYYEGGGTLLLSFRSGFDPQGEWALPFLPFSILNEGRPIDNYPTYWRAGEAMRGAVGSMDRVCYLPGVEARVKAPARVLVERVSPYFQRTADQFSSHAQVPPAPQPDGFPAVIAGERFVYFADQIFREFRQAGNTLAREAWREAMRTLVGKPPFGSELPKTVLLIPRRRGADLLLTLLHYIPTHNAHEVDLIEEPSGFAGELLHLPENARTARIFQGADLPRAADGAFVLPAAKGRLLVEVPGFFL